MNLFGMKKITDERIVNSQNKIYKEVFMLVMAICTISIVIKYYFYGVHINLVVTELLTIIISGIYYSIRQLKLGIYSDQVEIHDRTSKIPLSAKNIIIGLISGVVFSVFLGVRSAVIYGNGSNTLWYFILVFLASLMIYSPFFLVVTVIWNVVVDNNGKKNNPKD